MPKIFPLCLFSTFTSPSSSSSSSSFPPSPSSFKREILTVWMKSLVMHGNGCTVYSSDGQVIYRVDNYDHKCSDEVYLMDKDGRTLTTIRKKKFRMVGQWEGHQCIASPLKESKSWFHVQKELHIFNCNKHFKCKVRVGRGSVNPTCYNIVIIAGSANKSEYGIKDMAGGLIAEVKRKYSDSGVALGNDVFTLVVEPDVDQLLIMGIVVVCGLIDHSL